eukprot:scaffold133102_cov45-Attheya_sp.AAC.1
MASHSRNSSRIRRPRHNTIRHVLVAALTICYIVPDQQVAVEVVHVVPVGDCVDHNCDVPGRGQCFGWRVARLAEAEADAGVVWCGGCPGDIVHND